MRYVVGQLAEIRRYSSKPGWAPCVVLDHESNEDGTPCQDPKLILVLVGNDPFWAWDHEIRPLLQANDSYADK